MWDGLPNIWESVMGLMDEDDLSKPSSSSSSEEKQDAVHREEGQDASSSPLRPPRPPTLDKWTSWMNADARQDDECTPRERVAMCKRMVRVVGEWSATYRKRLLFRFFDRGAKGHVEARDFVDASAELFGRSKDEYLSAYHAIDTKRTNKINGHAFLRLCEDTFGSVLNTYSDEERRAFCRSPRVRSSSSSSSARTFMIRSVRRRRENDLRSDRRHSVGVETRTSTNAIAGVPRRTLETSLLRAVSARQQARPSWTDPF